jgi:acyl-coenzyme A synthetase/AMP-(fatty) acid ligase
LEDVLFTHPAVADCCVIGRADDRAGERPVAYVVLKAPASADELMQWVAARVVEYKHLAEVVLCDAIPKSATGKLLRRVLREQDLARAHTAR